jgi:hypothetical protein
VSLTKEPKLISAGLYQVDFLCCQCGKPGNVVLLNPRKEIDQFADNLRCIDCRYVPKEIHGKS